MLQKLADATDDTVIGLLVDHQQQIIDDCAAALAEITDVTWEKHDTAVIMGQALQAAALGLHHPAQALATNVFDTVIVWGYGDDKGRYQQAAKDMEKEHAWNERREAYTLIPILGAVRRFTGSTDPILAKWHRHGSVHAVSSTQYTQANALIALMTATSFLRELYEQDRGIGSGHPNS